MNDKECGLVFTAMDTEIIQYLKQVGYGWGRYAVSVEKQGFVTARQSATLKRMHARVKAGPTCDDLHIDHDNQENYFIPNKTLDR